MDDMKTLYIYEKNPVDGKIKCDGFMIAYKKYVCYNVEIKPSAKKINESDLIRFFIFKNCEVLDIPAEINMVEIGPIKTVRTAWSTNVESVCLKSGLQFINKIEKTTCYFLKQNRTNITILGDQLFKKHHDKMTEEIYTRTSAVCNTQNVNTDESRFQSKLDYYCDRFKRCTCRTDILELLREVNREYGLSLSHQDILFFLENAESWKNPLFMILDLAQSNSEHCRHHFLMDD